MSLPDLAACFLVQFDNRKGYILKWHRLLDDNELNLEGVIEFKCLPSGLHNVNEDLIYFAHGKYVGLAAFQSADATEEERNARFVSVGILAAQEQIWLYAQAMKDLAKQSVQDSDDVVHLEQFWDKQKSREGNGVESVADASLFNPTVATNSMSETLGPLLFPIYRSLLLRKRVLIVSQPPLRPVCNYVHLLSELAMVPDVAEYSNLHMPPPVKPLFTIGVQDLTDLAASAAWQGASQNEEQSAESTTAGWLACTSDELLATKYQLSEYRIKFTNVGKAGATSSPWPTLTRTVDAQHEEVIKATQRDLRRWKVLHHLSERQSQSAYTDDQEDVSVLDDDEDDRAQLLPENDNNIQSPDRCIPHENTIIEPVSWSASLNRWSAQSILSSELEQQQDQECLEAAAIQNRAITNKFDATTCSTFIISYFQALTKGMLSTLSRRISGLEGSSYRDEVEDSDDGEHAPLMPESGSNNRVVKLTKNDLIAMGLDAWSPRDVTFAKEMVQLYFGRQADVEAASVEVCGLRIC